jgi:hypothetical protein
MAGDPAAFPDQGVVVEESVHGRDRGQVVALVEEGGPYLGGGEVAELLGVERLEDVVFLVGVQRPG